MTDFRQALTELDWLMREESSLVHTENWQATRIADNSQAKMCELLHETLKVDMGHRDLAKYAQEIKPNLPWADDHFLERVCGEPLNPGVEWANWPWATSADTHRSEQGQFNHNYMERYWPKYAGRSNDGRVNSETVDLNNPNMGLRHAYGDLGGVIELLKGDPTTRQAYLPVWFPEDTGTAHDGRKPCTLGYHFIIRNGQLDVTYYIRSCDYFRHLQDDIYLTVRLALWVLEQCGFDDIKPGKFVMHITSLHMFVGDYSLKYGVQHHEL